MHADPTVQRKLLDIAELDSKLVHLRHQSAHLPENEKLSALQAERLALSERVTATQTRGDDAQRELDRAESELEPVRARLKRNQKRVDDGVVTDQRGLESLLAEIEHLKRRIDDLEESELTAMQEVEDQTHAHDELVAQRTGVENQMRTLLSQREDTKARLAAEDGELSRRRAGLVEGLPSDLLALYERILARNGSSGAAELRARRCAGCGLEVDISDLRRFAAAAPDEVLRCEECGRILVRTENSGL